MTKETFDRIMREAGAIYQEEIDSMWLLRPTFVDGDNDPALEESIAFIVRQSVHEGHI